MDMGPMGKEQRFNRGPGRIGGMMNKPKEMAQAPPRWGISFRVPDINAAAERVKANGGTILNGPLEVPGGDWILHAMDPQGAAFSRHAKKTAKAGTDLIQDLSHCNHQYWYNRACPNPWPRPDSQRH